MPDTKASTHALVPTLDSTTTLLALHGSTPANRRVAASVLLNRANHTGTQAIGTVSGLQAALDAKAPLGSPVQLPSYTVATLPPAADHPRSMIWVSDETGGATPAFSDGTDWRRVADRAVVA